MALAQGGHPDAPGGGASAVPRAPTVRSDPRRADPAASSEGRYFMSDETTNESLRRILLDCRRIAVVGVSADATRPSHGVAKYLLEHGYEVIPVNPRYSQVLGRSCYPTLAAAQAAGGPIDMVDCFRRAADIGPLAEDAIAIGARCLWMQLGVVNPQAAAKARAAGMEVVMDRCVKLEHARLIGDGAMAHTP